MKHLTISAAFLCMWASAARAGAATILVGPGEEHTTIRSAIDDASTGDVVQVLPGEYVENITLKEGVDVVGAGAEQCTVRSLSEVFPYVTVAARSNATLRGFTITGGYYGIRCSGASPTITDCVIWRNGSCGILLESSSPTVGRCVIAQNPRYGVQCLASSVPAISNCTFSANGYGIFSSESNPSLTNCILWDNWDDGITDGNLASHCDIQNDDFAGQNGNISAVPKFVAWNSFNDSENQLYVDIAHTGEEEGTRANPFTKIKSALSVYSYHLGIGSPCLNAGEGGVHMGAYPDETPSEPPGNDTVVVNVAPRTYYESRLFLCHRTKIASLPGTPATIVAFGDTVFYALDESSAENFIIRGGDNAIGFFFSVADVRDCFITECGQNAIYSFRSAPSIRGCHMYGNAGAGVLLDGGNVAIRDCSIGNHGAAGISCVAASWATIWNCLLTENPVGLSCNQGSGADVGNSTISGNEWRGVESLDGASVVIANSIVWENAFGELIEDGGTIQATFSDISGGFPGEGNLNGNPLFEVGPLGGFYLDSDSPCVDSGNDTAANVGLNEKTTRRTSEPDSGTVDIGFHYERFRITDCILPGGEVTLQWTSTPNLEYRVFRASSLGEPPSWEPLGEITASWMQQTYSFDEPPAPAEFYRIGRQ